MKASKSRNNNKQPCFHNFPTNHMKGLTLIELIIAIAVTAILVGMAVPYFSGMVAGHQVDTSFRTMRNFLDVARNEAINRKIYVSICPRKDTTGFECYDSNYGSSDDASEGWHQGWIMHHHRNKDGSASITNTSQIIKIQKELSDLVEIKLTGTPEYIRFNPYGESYPVNSTLSFCVKDASDEYHAKEIVLSNGRTRINTREDTSCL